MGNVFSPYYSPHLDDCIHLPDPVQDFYLWLLSTKEAKNLLLFTWQKVITEFPLHSKRYIIVSVILSLTSFNQQSWDHIWLFGSWPKVECEIGNIYHENRSEKQGRLRLREDWRQEIGRLADLGLSSWSDAPSNYHLGLPTELLS